MAKIASVEDFPACSHRHTDTYGNMGGAPANQSALHEKKSDVAFWISMSCIYIWASRLILSPPKDKCRT